MQNLVCRQAGNPINFQIKKFLDKFAFRHVLAIGLLGYLFIVFSSPVFAQNPQTNITIDVSKKTKDVNRLVLGQNLFFTLFDETGNNAQQIIPLLKEMRASVLRFPGGLFADVYHWYDAIGPYDPNKRICPVWPANTNANYTFRLDQFLDIAEAVGADTVFSVNEDTGSPEEARLLVEYTNSPLTQEIIDRANREAWTIDQWKTNPLGVPSGYYAWLRSKEGYGKRVKPWGVKYWEIGNEVYSEFCPPNSSLDSNNIRCDQTPTYCKYPRTQKTVINLGGEIDNMYGNGPEPVQNLDAKEVYIQRLSAYADEMRKADTSIKIGAVGLNASPKSTWNSRIATDPRTKDKINFIVDHPYFPPPPTITMDENTLNQSIVSAPYYMKNAMLSGWSGYVGSKPIAFTEHNVGYDNQYGGNSIDVRNALYTAGNIKNFLEFNTMMANFWHVRHFGIAANWGQSQLKLGPTGLVYKLYGKYLKDKLLSVTVPGGQDPNYTHAMAPVDWMVGYPNVPDLDILATVSNDNSDLSIFVLNSNITRTHTITLNLGNFQYNRLEKAELKTTKTGNDTLYAKNTGTNEVFIDTQTSGNSGQNIPVTMLPNSFAVVNVKNVQGEVIIRAKGSICQSEYPSMELWSGDRKLTSWTGVGSNECKGGALCVGPTYEDFTYTSPTPLGNPLYVKFQNDCSSATEDRNLFVDYIIADGKKYESEDTTGSVGIYPDPATGKMELIGPPGYFKYNISASCPKRSLGDINCDSSINTLDYQIVVNSLNLKDNKYTIFDLNTIVANFGK